MVTLLHNYIYNSCYFIPLEGRRESKSYCLNIGFLFHELMLLTYFKLILGWKNSTCFKSFHSFLKDFKRFFFVEKSSFEKIDKYKVNFQIWFRIHEKPHFWTTTYSIWMEWTFLSTKLQRDHFCTTTICGVEETFTNSKYQKVIALKTKTTAK